VTAERRPGPARRHPTREPAAHGDALRRLAGFAGDVVPPRRDPAHGGAPYGLDERTAALARLATLIALDAPPASYRRTVHLALAAGASVDDVIDTLVVVARTVGLARVVAAAPRLARAAGYDVDAALETFEREGDPTT
jgi:alkylhydroperoxidase/carboxymuconolactone decarboxylase family protein YurZ